MEDGAGGGEVLAVEVVVGVGEVIWVEAVEVDDLDDGFELGASLFSVVRVALVLVLWID